jgi:hypothetical protein
MNVTNLGIGMVIVGALWGAAGWLAGATTVAIAGAAFASLGLLIAGATMSEGEVTTA